MVIDPYPLIRLPRSQSGLKTDEAVQAAKAQVCTPEACVPGTSSSHGMPLLSSPIPAAALGSSELPSAPPSRFGETALDAFWSQADEAVLVTDADTNIAYLPGIYPSSSSSPSSHFSSPLNQSITPSTSNPLEGSSGAMLVSHPIWPAAFTKPTYRGDIRAFTPDAFASIPGPGDAQTNPEDVVRALMDGWKSLYLPQGWYAVPADGGGQVVWGAVVDEKELPKDWGRTMGRMSSCTSIDSSMSGGPLGGWSMGIPGGTTRTGVKVQRGRRETDVLALCSTPCSSNGICVPSATNTTDAALGQAQCVCQAGWAGAQCEQCAKGFYGSKCKRESSGLCRSQDTP